MKNVLALALVAALSASCSSPAPPDDAVASNESTPVEPSTQLPYDLQAVDFVNLRARLRQNTVLEKLGNLWLTRLLAMARENELAEVP